MDFAEARERTDFHFGRCNEYYGAILEMERMDIVKSTAGYDMIFEDQVSKTCVPWPRNFSERCEICSIKNL